MAQIPSFRFKCPNCGNQYPMMLDGGKCFCGGILFDTQANIKEDNSLWYTEAFKTFPCVLAHEYHRLYNLSQSQNTYGVFLQLKDVIESTIKFIVLAVCIYGKSQNIKGREEAYEKEIAGEKLSLGHWVDIANLMRTFYKSSSVTPHQSIAKRTLPASLWKLLDKMQAWVGNNQLVNWRNEKLGHGALRFDDDPEFQVELMEKIKAITQFYRDNNESFTEIHIVSNGVCLLGFENARDLSSENAKCELVIESQKMLASPFIQHVDYGIFFYDEIIKRKNSRMLSYPNGHTKLQYCEYTAHLADLLHGRSVTLRSSIESEFITKDENDFLAKLSFDSEYIEPKYLTEWLRKCVDSHPKGVFLLEMERGCGKTFFTEKLNSRFAKPQIIAEDMDVRTYHLSRTQLGGVKEFVAGITSEWNQGFEHGSDMAHSIALECSGEVDRNSIALSDFLSKWRQYTSTSDARYRRQRIMLVLDGLDEIKECDADIWSFIPRADQLTEGVYILLTGRNTQTDSLPISYINRINALKVSESMRIAATSEENQSLLKAYIAKAKLPSIEGDLAIELMQMAEYKMLGLSMLCYQIKNEGISDTSRTGMSNITCSYLNMIEKQYNAMESAIFRRTLAILASVCEYEPLSLREIADLLLMGSIRLELLGLLADISPLLTVERIVSIDGDIYWDTNRYHYANADVSDTIRKYLDEDYKNIILDMFQNTRTEFTESYSDGSIALISHTSSILGDADIFIDWKADDVVNINAQVKNYYQDTAFDSSIADFRLLNTADQIIQIAHTLDPNNRDVVTPGILEAYFLKLSVHSDMANRFLVVQEMMKLVKNAHFVNRAAKNYALCRVYTENALTFNSNDTAQKALEYADEVKNKDKNFLEAEIFACDAYLRTDMRENYDNIYHKSREDIANRCLRLIIAMIRNGTDFEKSKLFEVCMRIAFFFEEDEESANLSTAYRYYELYYKHFENVEKRRKLSLKEKGQFSDLLARLTGYYIKTGEYDKALQHLSSALDKLKSITQTSAVVSHAYLLERYSMVAACTYMLHSLGCTNNGLINELYDQLVEFTWSIPLNLLSTFVGSAENIIDFYNIITPTPGTKSTQNLIDLVKKLETIECIDESGDVNKLIGNAYAQLGIAALDNIESMEKEDVLLHKSLAEKAIRRFEKNDDDEEWMSHYFTMKCWIAISVYSSKLLETKDLKSNDADTEILRSLLIAFYWVLVGKWPQEVREMELPDVIEMISCFVITELNRQANEILNGNSYNSTASARKIKKEVDKYSSTIRKDQSLNATRNGWRLLSDVISKFGKKDNLVEKTIISLSQAYSKHADDDHYLLANYLLVFYETTILGHEADEMLEKMTEKITEAAECQGTLYYKKVSDDMEAAERLAEAERVQEEERLRKEQQMAQEEMKRKSQLALAIGKEKALPALDRVQCLFQTAKAFESSPENEQTAALYQKALDVCKAELSINENSNDCGLLCLYGKILDHYSIFLSKQNDYKYISVRMDLISVMEKLAAIRPEHYNEKLALLYESMGDTFDRIGNNSETRRLYTAAKDLFMKTPHQKARVKKISSWFQTHEKLTIYGHIQCRLSQMGEPTHESVRDGTNKMLWEHRFCMSFSKDSLLPIIDTAHEKDFFYRLLDDINGREVWFFMTPGGDTFSKKTSCCGMEEYLTLAYQWMNDLEELGFPDFLYEKIVDKDSLWVCEFFTKLLHYGKMKYSS